MVEVILVGKGRPLLRRANEPRFDGARFAARAAVVEEVLMKMVPGGERASSCGRCCRISCPGQEERTFLLRPSLRNDEIGHVSRMLAECLVRSGAEGKRPVALMLIGIGPSGSQKSEVGSAGVQSPGALSVGRRSARSAAVRRRAPSATPRHSSARRAAAARRAARRAGGHRCAAVSAASRGRADRVACGLGPVPWLSAGLKPIRA